VVLDTRNATAAVYPLPSVVGIVSVERANLYDAFIMLALLTKSEI